MLHRVPARLRSRHPAQQVRASRAVAMTTQRAASSRAGTATQRSPSLAGDVLQWQRQYGNQAVTRMLHRMQATGASELRIFRDLARRPPGRRAEPVALTQEQIDDAIAFNTARFNTESIRAIQDVVGVSPTGTVDADTIHMIVEMQADFRQTTDGKVGLQTLRLIALELIAVGQRNPVIRLIIDGHNISTANLTSIRFDATLGASNARTGGPIPGNSTVRIGPPAFAQGYEGLVHTIAHELEHVRQRAAGIPNQDEREFLGEAVEIMSAGMLSENLAGFMDDAGRALFHFNRLPAADQTRLGPRFLQVRTQVTQRFNAASAANQATHQATMDGYNAVAVP